MDAELHREENDLYLGHPWIGAATHIDETVGPFVCQCGHSLIFHVHIPPDTSACTHGGCGCTHWKEQHDETDG